MTYVISSGYDVIGTSQSLEGVMKLVGHEFEEFCNNRGIPPHTESGGVYLPDIREPKPKHLGYAHWWKTADKNMWKLRMGNLHQEFMAFRIFVSYFQDVEIQHQSRFKSNMMKDALDHAHFQPSGNYTFNCEHDLGDLIEWRNLPGFHEALTWRLFNACENFRNHVRTIYGFEGYPIY